MCSQRIHKSRYRQSYKNSGNNNFRFPCFIQIKKMTILYFGSRCAKMFIFGNRIKPTNSTTGETVNKQMHKIAKTKKQQ